ETKSKHHQHYRDRESRGQRQREDKTRDRDRDRQSGRRREDRREDRKHHRHADEVEKHRKSRHRRKSSSSSSSSPRALPSERAGTRARLKEQEQEQRDRESENFRQWWQQEDAFHLKQARARSAIRIAEGRAKPIDLLAGMPKLCKESLVLKLKRDDGADDNDDEFDEDEKIGTAERLNRRRLSDSETFWSCVALLVQHALDSKTAPAASSATAAVADRIDAVIRGKSASQLAALEDSNLRDRPGTDLAYWEEMLDKVKVAKGKATLGRAVSRPTRERKSTTRKWQRRWRRGSARAGRENRRDCGENSRLAAWSDRLKPKKPRYFKSFNIFYPDLLDKSKAPSYSTEPCKEQSGNLPSCASLLPPYEDVSFKIVRNEMGQHHLGTGSAASLLSILVSSETPIEQEDDNTLRIKPQPMG
uniref:Splicing factor Cactin n=1 Tax=Macrostomum lignano TaxID=282301 RepID=A0A1I8FRE4_9PLAT